MFRNVPPKRVVVPLAALAAVLALACRADAQVKPFQITGEGVGPQGLPVPGQPARTHWTVGEATHLGRYRGQGTVRTCSAVPDFATGTISGEFGSGSPFVFTGADGDELVTWYGRTKYGASEPGSFVLAIEDVLDDGSLLVNASWVAEFVAQPDESTGKFAGATGGWVMHAWTTEPFVLGSTDPVSYAWEGEGSPGSQCPAWAGAGDFLTSSDPPHVKRRPLTIFGHGRLADRPGLRPLTFLPALRQPAPGLGQLAVSAAGEEGRGQLPAHPQHGLPQAPLFNPDGPGLLGDGPRVRHLPHGRDAALTRLLKLDPACTLSAGADLRKPINHGEAVGRNEQDGSPPPRPTKPSPVHPRLSLPMPPNFPREGRLPRRPARRLHLPTAEVVQAGRAGRRARQARLPNRAGEGPSPCTSST
jgi:hypothetical protein